MDVSNRNGTYSTFRFRRAVDGPERFYQTLCHPHVKTLRTAMTSLRLASNLALPTDQRFRLLNLNILFPGSYICWAYEPKKGRGIFLYHSAHSKLVKKRGVDSTGIKAVVKKPCTHLTHDILTGAIERVKKVGYPQSLVLGVVKGQIGGANI